MKKQRLIKNHHMVWESYKKCIPHEILEVHETELRKAFFNGVVWATEVVNDHNARLQRSAVLIAEHVIGRTPNGSNEGPAL